MKRPNKHDFDFSEDYKSNLETYCDELEKALDKACELLESATEYGQLPCPCEYLGICHCESTENGYECDGYDDYKWKDALLKDE